MSILAYFDSFAGLVPCRIISAEWDKWNGNARIQYTATRGAYKRGAFDTQPLRHVVPRSAIRRRRYSTTIRPYRWRDIVKAP